MEPSNWYEKTPPSFAVTTAAVVNSATQEVEAQKSLLETAISMFTQVTSNLEGIILKNNGAIKAVDDTVAQLAAQKAALIQTNEQATKMKTNIENLMK